jgi:hypothetical protein
MNAEPAAPVDLVNRIRGSIIGRDTVIEPPFGRRRLTHADYTASAYGVSVE